ncbi:MAG: hypothetical protein OXD01_07460 [Gammaproteobacteria bacterium]|nr:hypothetical protein [Gammaproteobacteria bacterium]
MTTTLETELEKKVTEKCLKKAFDSIDLVKKFPLKNKGVVVTKKGKWITPEGNDIKLEKLKVT